MPNNVNILLITSDQQHYSTIGRYNPEISTPNLDRLCGEGICFSRAYTVNPTCTPTRASMITGKYPSQHGAWTLGTKLPEGEHTVGEDFAAAGYRTALVGKAHFQPLHDNERYPSLEAHPTLHDLAFWKSFSGPFYGFEHIELLRNHTSEAHVGQHYALWLEERCPNWRDYFQAPAGSWPKDRLRRWDIPEEFHYDAWIAERTNALLEQYGRNRENFFLWASFPDPHPPYLVPEPYASLYDPQKITVGRLEPGEHDRNSPYHRLTQAAGDDWKRYKTTEFGLHGVHSHLHDREELRRDAAVYYGMVTMMDRYIGKILDKLDELGLARNTVVVFTSDHGHFYGQHGMITKGPFHYEDMIRVPFIARYPGQERAGQCSDAIQSLVDLPETFLDFCGIGLPDGTSGVSQKEVWQGKKDRVRSWASCEHHHEERSVSLRTYVGERYKITVYDNLDEDCGDLFDLAADPGELHNRWSDPGYGGVKCRLLEEFVRAEIQKEPKFMPRVSTA